MENQLLQAYYWLSSAIAQAFAALIALSGMFYIFRIGLLRKRAKELQERFTKIKHEELDDIKHRHSRLLNITIKLTRHAYIAIFTSGLAMFSGMLALFFSPVIACNSWRWITMSIEIGIAILALVFTIFVVIKMIEGA